MCFIFWKGFGDISINFKIVNKRSYQLSLRIVKIITTNLLVQHCTLRPLHGNLFEEGPCLTPRQAMLMEMLKVVMVFMKWETEWLGLETYLPIIVARIVGFIISWGAWVGAWIGVVLEVVICTNAVPAQILIWREEKASKKLSRNPSVNGVPLPWKKWAKKVGRGTPSPLLADVFCDLGFWSLPWCVPVISSEKKTGQPFTHAYKNISKKFPKC